MVLGWVKNTVRRLDSWVNNTSGLGDPGRDRRLHAQIQRRAPLTEHQLAALYDSSDTVARIVDKPAAEMLREPLILPTDRNGKLADEIEALDVYGKLEVAIAWMRLNGGSLVLIGADDGRGLHEPLDVENLHGITYLSVFSRFEAKPFQYYTDPHKPKYEHVELYELWPEPVRPDGSLTGLQPGQMVHESRCIRFDALPSTPRASILCNDGWTPGFIDRIHNVIRDFDSAYEGVALLLTEYVQNVYKLQDLGTKESDDDLGYLMLRLAQLDLARSSARAIPLDAEHESFERVSPAGVQGLADLVDRMDRRLAMAADMPVQLLSGEAAGGLNAGGAADAMTENFYNVIRAAQRKHLRPAFGKLLPLLAAGAGIQVTRGKRVPFDFAPLWQPSDLEIAKAHEHQANADVAQVTAGILAPHEVAKSRYGTGKYSMATTLDDSVDDAAREAPAIKAARENPSPAPGSGSASAPSSPAA